MACDRNGWWLSGLLLALCLVVPGTALAVADGTVSGRVVTPGAGPGFVLLYDAGVEPVPEPEYYLQVPDFTAAIAADGQFATRVPVGRYYLGVLVREKGPDQPGPPVAGDMLCSIRRPDDVMLVVTVDAGATTRVPAGVVTCSAYQPVSAAALAAGQDSARMPEGLDPRLRTGVGGIIRDVAGKAVAGVIVFFDHLVDGRRQGRYLAAASAADGHYFARLPAAGSYRLRAVRTEFTGLRFFRREDDQWRVISPLEVEVKPGSIVRDFDLVVGPP